MNRFSRSLPLIGTAGLEKLGASHVAVFGLGGVGGAAAEALARAGVGTMTLIDGDVVDKTNLNRQIIAFESTVGRPKAAVMKERLKDINPKICLECFQLFFDEDSCCKIDFMQFDYVIDAIDTVRSKLLLIKTAKEYGTPAISAMGAGNKLDPTGFKVSDISETRICPLARIMRKKLKEIGITHHKVVYSEEVSCRVSEMPTGTGRFPASVSFVPPVMGYILAGETVKDLLKV